MSDGEVFARVAKYIVLGIVVVIVAGIGSCQATKYQVLRAIEAGADPLEAKCALDGSSVDGNARSDTSCMLLYARKQAAEK